MNKAICECAFMIIHLYCSGIILRVAGYWYSLTYTSYAVEGFWEAKPPQGSLFCTGCSGRVPSGRRYNQCKMEDLGGSATLQTSHSSRAGAPSGPEATE